MHSLELFSTRLTRLDMEASSKTPTLILAGTEPAGIFVSNDAGNTWDFDPVVLKLRDANGWFLP
jgi:hypothetical protein